MKSNSLLLGCSLLAGMLSWGACHLTEVPPTVNHNVTSRNILIEEETGIRCANCPQGAAISEAIATQNPGHVEVIEEYSQFQNQLSAGYPDFRNTFSDDLDAFLGGVPLKPCAAIDRVLFSGQTNIWTDRSTWAGFAATELAKAPLLQLTVTDSFVNASRLLTVQVHGVYLQDINNAHAISVAITESGMKGHQDDSQTVGGIDTAYIFNHVLRTMLTASTGDNIAASAKGGDAFTRSYSFTLPAGWNAANCRVIAFVSQTGTDKEVYQVAGADLN